MIIAFINEKGDPAPWREVLTEEVPGLDFRVWPDEVTDPAEIDIAVVALPPPGLLKTFPNLKAILSMWAGVESMLLDPDLPRDVPIGRLVDRAMTRDMMHHAVQCGEPDWCTVFCHDPAAAAASRRRILGEVAGTDITVVPAHFPGATAGHVRSEEIGRASCRERV